MKMKPVMSAMENLQDEINTRHQDNKISMNSMACNETLGNMMRKKNSCKDEQDISELLEFLGHLMHSTWRPQTEITRDKNMQNIAVEIF